MTFKSVFYWNFVCFLFQITVMPTRFRLTFFALALVITVVQSARIAHIDPVTSFSARYYSQDKPVLAATNKLLDEFTLRASPSDTFPKDRLRVRFTVPDLEDFDLALNLDPVVSQRTRIIAGVPGDEHEVPVTPATYSSTTTNEDGTATIATFTVMNDGLLDGLVIRDGDIYQVTPTAFLEADAATMEDPEEQQAVRFHPSYERHSTSMLSSLPFSHFLLCFLLSCRLSLA